MPTNLTNFQKDLANPESGAGSELYRAVQPFTDVESYGEPSTPHEAQKLNKLKQDVRRGVVGLEYLTGLKNNEVETFYDAHPVQALTSDALGSSGKLGLTAALGIPAGNIFRQYKNLKETENAYHSRRDDPLQKAEARLYPTPKKDGSPGIIDEDIMRLFGSSELRGNNHESLLRRLKVLDQVSGAQTGHSHSKHIAKYLKAIKSAKGAESREAALRSFYAELDKLRGTQASKNLRAYVDLHKDLSSLKEKGYSLKGDILGGLGDSIHEAVGDFKNNVTSKSKRLGALIDSAIPSSNQGLEDLIRKRILDVNPNSYNEELVKQILADTHNIDFIGNSPEAKKMESNLFSSLRNEHTGKPLNRLIRRLGPSVALGAGVAGAGMGIHKLLSLLQSKAYGDEKIKEWKKNSLKAKGEFEKAERIK